MQWSYLSIFNKKPISELRVSAETRFWSDNNILIAVKSLYRLLLPCSTKHQRYAHQSYNDKTTCVLFLQCVICVTSVNITHIDSLLQWIRLKYWKHLIQTALQGNIRLDIDAQHWNSESLLYWPVVPKPALGVSITCTVYFSVSAHDYTKQYRFAPELGLFLHSYRIQFQHIQLIRYTSYLTEMCWNKVGSNPVGGLWIILPKSNA